MVKSKLWSVAELENASVWKNRRRVVSSIPRLALEVLQHLSLTEIVGDFQITVFVTRECLPLKKTLTPKLETTYSDVKASF